MMGSEIRPMEMTDAATTPVVAASSAPTKITARARPPRIGPKTWPTVSSRSSAMPLRSRIRPMRVKKGTASSVSLDMIPISRWGSQAITDDWNTPSSMPTRPKKRPQAPRLKATGKPSSRKQISPANMIGAKLATMNSMVFFRLGQCCGFWCCAWRGIGLLGGFRFGLAAQGFDQLGFCRLVGQAAPWGRGPWPRRKARRLISSDQPCKSSKVKPIGSAAHTGQRIRPPELPDISPDWYIWITTGTDR